MNYAGDNYFMYQGEERLDYTQVPRENIYTYIYMVHRAIMFIAIADTYMDSAA